MVQFRLSCHTHILSVDALKPDWDRCRDCYIGQRRIKSRRELYLPKPRAMSPESYEAYLNRAVYFGIYRRTVSSMLGLLYNRKPVVVVHPNFPSDDVGGYRSLLALAADVSKEFLIMGRCGLWVDFDTDRQVSTLRTVRAEDIVTWRSDGDRLTEIVIAGYDFTVNANSSSDDDPTPQLEQRKILTILTERPYTATSYALSKKSNKWVIVNKTIPLERGEPREEIPFRIGVLGLRDDPEAAPPLLPLADLTIGHYQVGADARHSLFYTSLATPWVSGVNSEDEILQMGGDSVWVLGKDGKAGLLEIEGKGVEAMQNDLKRYEEEMGALGAQHVASHEIGPETATTTAIRLATESSQLTAIANETGEVVSWGLRLAHEWMGLAAMGSVTLDTSFLRVPEVKAAGGGNIPEGSENVEE